MSAAGDGCGPGELIAAYHERLAADPAAVQEQAERLAEAFAAAGINYDGRPMRTLLRPHFIGRPQWEELRRSARRLLELLARVARRAFEGDVTRLCAWLGMPEAEARWVALDPGEPDVLWSRLDAFAAPGGPRFIEVNSDAPAGFGYADRMARVFEAQAPFRELERRFPIRYAASAPALVEAVLGAFHARGGRGTPRVAIVDFAHVKTRPDQEILREAFLERGAPCLLADPRDCELRGGRLFAAGAPADVVYRRAVLSELVAAETEVRGLLAAYAARAACFVNSFRCRLSEDKAFFALVSDEQFAPLLEPAERALLERVVPWTRKLEARRTSHGDATVELLDFTVAERERLVLKPAHGYGGQDVLIGSETSAAAWEQAVARGAGAGFVVQQRQAIPEEPFPSLEAGRLEFVPLKLNVNPFYVRGADVGAVARVSRASVINVGAGGGSVPTFVVG